MGAVAKRKVGRPKEGLDTLHDDWAAQVQAKYQEGASDAEIQCLLGAMRGTHFSKDLWYRWLDEEPEFSDTIKAGRALARGWWEETARKQAQEGKGNATTLIFMMKNRWGEDYQDVRKVEGAVTHNHTGALPSFDSRITELLKRGQEIDVTPSGED